MPSLRDPARHNDRSGPRTAYPMRCSAYYGVWPPAPGGGLRGPAWPAARDVQGRGRPAREWEA
jgi:hypothetical protein